MKTLVTTLSAAVLGFASLTSGNVARADSFSISFPDASFSYSDDEYSGTDYSQTPIYIVNNGWSSPSADYRRHPHKRYWHKAHHRGHKHHRRHNGHNYRHRGHRGHYR